MKRTLSRDLVVESFRSGTIASLLMMPVGFLFRVLDLRIGHYGKKLIEVFFGELPLPLFRTIVVVEHFIIGWLSTTPLLIALLFVAARSSVSLLWVGLAYGVGYYIVLNSWLLPVAFGDPTPWMLGFSHIYPSLIVHIVFGISIAATAKRFVAAHTAGGKVSNSSSRHGISPLLFCVMLVVLCS